MFKFEIVTWLPALCWLTSQYSAQLTMDTSSTTTITDYYQDLGSCQCDLLNSCDNFCCCDESCSTNSVTTWTANGWCRQSAAEVEIFCDELSNSGFSSFQDLACVYYSNRGSIGYFYNLPASSEIVQPSAQKFANKIETITDITSSTSTSTAYNYQSVINVQLDASQTTFKVWRPVAGSGCNVGYVYIDQSQSFSCVYPLEQCATANAYLAGTLNICKNADCSDTQTITPTISNATYTSSSKQCSGVITDIDITLTLTYSGSQYSVSSAAIATTTNTITNQPITITTTITVNTGSASSGNPGYTIGKEVQFDSNDFIQEFADSSTRQCLTSASSNALSIPFGINLTYSCEMPSSKPCSTDLQIDTIVDKKYRLAKYPTTETTGITITGDNRTCNKQRIILNILYSQAGWVLDYQNYILAAQVTSESPADITTFTGKYLQINWISVDPQTVVTPPSNYFYQYFSYLWYPLRSAYQTYLWTAHLILPAMTMIIYML